MQYEIIVLCDSAWLPLDRPQRSNMPLKRLENCEMDINIGSNHWIYFGLQLRANDESHDENRGHH